MPANLPPQYFEAEKKYRAAKTPQEKIRALKEMLAIMPKHKGTEKLQADLKRRISKLNEEIEHTRRTGRRYTEYVKKSGAGQVVLIGPPNSGKSSIVAALTHATPEIGSYPFTTKKLLPAMMRYEDIQIQLVDTPPITRTYYEGWLSNIVRECDLVLLTIGVDDYDPEESFTAITSHMEGSGIKFTGKEVETDVPDYRTVEKKTIIVVNKVDLGGSEIIIELLKPLAGDIPFKCISCTRRQGLEELRKTIFEALSIVRIYTKVPGKKPDLSKPFVVRKGTTVLEMAGIIHKDFSEKFKFARVWGHAKYDGQRVEKDYVLEDGDIVELHTSG